MTKVSATVGSATGRCVDTLTSTARGGGDVVALGFSRSVLSKACGGHGRRTGVVIGDIRWTTDGRAVPAGLRWCADGASAVVAGQAYAAPRWEADVDFPVVLESNRILAARTGRPDGTRATARDRGRGAPIGLELYLRWMASTAGASGFISRRQPSCRQSRDCNARQRARRDERPWLMG
jgi:hypothetical protein